MQIGSADAASYALHADSDEPTDSRVATLNFATLQVADSVYIELRRPLGTCCDILIGRLNPYRIGM